MRALSVRQPWPWLILRPDIVGEAARAEAYAKQWIKDIENRDWPTKVRGRVLIHASKGMTMDEYEDGQDLLRFVCGSQASLPPPDQLPRGGIVGSVEIVDCVRLKASPWFFGRFGFALRDPKPLPFVPWKGRLGFFEVPASAFIANGEGNGRAGIIGTSR